MTHPDPHHAICENIVQLRREYDDATARGRANFLNNASNQNTQRATERGYLAQEAPMVHVEPQPFDDMLTPGELLAKAYKRLVWLAFFMSGMITSAVILLALLTWGR